MPASEGRRLAITPARLADRVPARVDRLPTQELEVAFRVAIEAGRTLQECGQRAA